MQADFRLAGPMLKFVRSRITSWSQKTRPLLGAGMPTTKLSRYDMLVYLKDAVHELKYDNVTSSRSRKILTVYQIAIQHLIIGWERVCEKFSVRFTGLYWFVFKVGRKIAAICQKRVDQKSINSSSKSSTTEGIFSFHNKAFNKKSLFYTGLNTTLHITAELSSCRRSTY